MKHVSMGRFAAGIVSMGLLGGSWAAGAANTTFFQFTAQPNGATNPPEFVFSPTTGLSAGPGAVGDGSFLAPGLLGTITGGLAGIPFAPPGYGPGPNYFLLSDLTLSLTGFVPVGSATATGSSLSQDLGAGTFSITYDAPGGVGSPFVLLTGSVASSVLTVQTTDTSASVLSGAVTYTGGLLVPQLAADGLDTQGVFSFGLTSVTGPGGTVLVDRDSRIAPFTADAVGMFDAVSLPGGGPPFPEPSTAFLGTAALAWLASHRRRD